MKNFPCRDSRSMLFSWALPRCRTALRCLIGALWLGAAAAFAAPLAYLADRNQNTVSVVGMTTYSTLTTISLGAAQSSPVELVANEASGKVFVALGTGVAIIDPRTNALAGEIPLALIKAMVVSPDGKKVYALTPGSVTMAPAPQVRDGHAGRGPVRCQPGHRRGRGNDLRGAYRA